MCQRSLSFSYLLYFYVRLILLNQHYKTYNFGVCSMGRATRALKDLTRVCREAERGGIEKQDYIKRFSLISLMPSHFRVF